MDASDIYKAIKDWINSPRFKPIQIIFLIIGLAIAMFTYTETFKSLDAWIKFAIFATWSLALLLSSVSIGSVKNLIEKAIAIFADSSKPIEQKYEELMSAFLVVARELGMVFDTYNKTQNTSPETIPEPIPEKIIE